MVPRPLPAVRVASPSGGRKTTSRGLNLSESNSRTTLVESAKTARGAIDIHGNQLERAFHCHGFWESLTCDTPRKSRRPLAAGPVSLARRHVIAAGPGR